MNIKNLFVKPKITEKSLGKTKGSIYSFEVQIGVTKPQIKKAVEEIFKVTVGEVKTIVRKGKMRRVGKRQSAKKLSDRKIAYVQVTTGKIDLFPQT